MECHCLAEKGHAGTEPGVTTQGRKEVEVGTLLLSNDKTMLLPKIY